jgi:four helix bundle protein
MSTVLKFTELRAWQVAHTLALEVYRLSDGFPRAEQFGLTSQIRRAAVSVSANIAEGFRRKSGADQLRFYNISVASLSELEAELLLARDLGYIPADYPINLFDCIDHAGRCLTLWIHKRPT